MILNKNSLKYILELTVNFMVDKKIIWLFYFFIKYRLKVIYPAESNNNGLSIMALNVDRFRGDLEVLAQNGFTVYLMPYAWQTRIFYAYRDRDDRENFLFQKCYDRRIAYDRSRVRKFLAVLLSKLYSSHNIDCVVGANLFYNQDIDWGAVSSLLGYPYIILHRENLVVNDCFYRIFIDRAKKLKKIRFSGDAIIFHNEIVSNIYKKYSGVDADRIHAYGALRMDSFIKKISSGFSVNKINKTVTLFYFHPRGGIISDKNYGFYELFHNVMNSYIQLAIKNPNIDFVIKHKDLRWEMAQHILSIYDINYIDNLTIYGPEKNAQELIFESDVVTGFCSTTMLEAAIAKKPVVFPLFSEASKDEYRDFLCFKDYLEIFDLAHSTVEFSNLIIKNIHNAKISADVMRLRRDKFNEIVSPLSGDASIKYSELIATLCRERSVTSHL